MTIDLVIIVLVTLILLFVLYKETRVEHHDSGAIIQLMAKDPQDSYLTGDAWKYYPPYFYPYYLRPKKSELPLY